MDASLQLLHCSGRDDAVTVPNTLPKLTPVMVTKAVVLSGCGHNVSGAMLVITGAWYDQYADENLVGTSSTTTSNWKR